MAKATKTNVDTLIERAFDLGNRGRKLDNVVQEVLENTYRSWNKSQIVDARMGLTSQDTKRIEDAYLMGYDYR